MITPVGGWIVVKPIEESQTTASGLYVARPTSAVRQGLVVATSDTHEVKCPLSVGDKIIFYNQVGTEVKDNDELFLMFKFDAVMGKVS